MEMAEIPRNPRKRKPREPSANTIHCRLSLSTCVYIIDQGQRVPGISELPLGRRYGVLVSSTVCYLYELKYTEPRAHAILAGEARILLQQLA